MTTPHTAERLVRFATDLLAAGGLPPDRASIVAEVLVEADLLGHDTHGLHLLAGYLNALADGKLTADGHPDIVSETPVALTWDGRYLPGPWLVCEAMRAAEAKLAGQGMAAVSIRRSHHIACLAAYLKRATDKGLIMLLASSDPFSGSVAPFGGLKGVYTPNPLAAGIPTSGDPIMLDVSMSITTNGMSGRVAAEGSRLPGKWLQDAKGAPTDDPAVLDADEPGSLLPIGGQDYGHKGFALGLLIEALTSALAGKGRADGSDRWGASVLVLLIDPKAFGGSEAFVRETGWLADACRAVPPKDPARPVRLPGERGLRRRETQLASGVDLHPGILPALRPWADRLGVPMP
ncbi:Ldh family oxidoreductase [Marinivivus vitaminiproducens]|uniref:Ldh family oxidoreductase n=1 Tax=Marinivivus vitaminiproducens TaxID=3035935 RepID=UPI0027A4C5EA|nr:Ldh family oxidoreductase [Geminicoccaceae bacterium SCSIO 64248]